MNDVFERRIRAAAVAGWWTLAIAVAFLSMLWFYYLYLASHQPEWMLRLCGPYVTWESIAHAVFWLVGVLKLCLWLSAFVVIWLTLWARQLRKQPGGA